MSLVEKLNTHGSALDDVTMNDLWNEGKKLFTVAWGRTSRRMRTLGAIVLLL
jgi:hypothetical protein